MDTVYPRIIRFWPVGNFHSSSKFAKWGPPQTKPSYRIEDNDVIRGLMWPNRAPRVGTPSSPGFQVPSKQVVLANPRFRSGTARRIPHRQPNRAVRAPYSAVGDPFARICTKHRSMGVSGARKSSCAGLVKQCHLGIDPRHVLW